MLCVNDAQYRFERTYNKIKISGLLNYCERIIVVLVGKYNFEYSEQLKKLILDNKITYILSNNDKSEVDTINIIYSFAIKFMYERIDYNILYLHSKGVTRPNLTKQMIGWMDYMEYFLIEEYERCLNILKDYRTCGVLYRNGCRIYGGNFWWAKSSYIITLKPLFVNINRFDCEHWLLNNNNHNKVKEFSLCDKFDWAWGFYNKICERKEYTSLPSIVNDYSILSFLDNCKINIDYALFGGIDCKEIIKNSIIDNKIYLRADNSLVNYEYVPEHNRYLDIKINNDIIKIGNEQYLIYGY